MFSSLLQAAEPTTNKLFVVDFPEITGSAADLAHRIELLPAWYSDRDLSDAEWQQFFEVARLLQNSDPLAVQLALRRYWQSHRDDVPAEMTYEPMSRTTLVLRVMFDLPAADANNYRSSWPIGWKEGNPVLLARWRGMAAGGWVAPDVEYRFFLERYRFKHLVAKPLASRNGTAATTQPDNKKNRKRNGDVAR